MKIDTIIFDMDGVLVDTEPVYLELIEKMYKDIGANVSREVHLTSLGVESEKWWEYILETYNVKGHTPAELAGIERKTITAYLEGPEIKKRFFKNLKEVLEALKNRGLKLGVASSNARDIIEEVLKIGGLRDYFDVVVSGTDSEVEHSKPSPDIFLHAADLLGSEPQNCLVVEDSESGLTAAHRAGMRSYAFLSAPRPIRLDEADYTFDNYGVFFKNIEDLI